jgi:hypothetical protein
MFHAIQAATANKGIFSAMDAYRPWWLSPSVHALNVVVAWADMLISGKRSFSRVSERMSTALVLGYILLLNLSGYMNGCVAVDGGRRTWAQSADWNGPGRSA